MIESPPYSPASSKAHLLSFNMPWECCICEHRGRFNSVHVTFVSLDLGFWHTSNSTYEKWRGIYRNNSQSDFHITEAAVLPHTDLPHTEALLGVLARGRSRDDSTCTVSIVMTTTFVASVLGFRHTCISTYEQSKAAL